MNKHLTIRSSVGPLLALCVSQLAACYEVVGPDPVTDAGPDVASDASPVRCPVTPAAPLVISRTRVLGTPWRPDRVTGGLGATIETHQGPRWIFAEVGLAPSDVDPRHRLNATIAVPVPGSPLEVFEPGVARGAPFEALPYVAGEHVGALGERDGLLALWPAGAGVPVGDRTALFVARWRVRPGFLNLQSDGIEAAWWSRDLAPAARTNVLVYAPGERAYIPAAVDGDDVYLQSCRFVGALDTECRVARTTRDHVFDRASLRYWDGAGWSSDPSSAAVAVRGMNGFTLAWNRHLARWVAVYAEILGNRIFARTSPRPEGPYSDAVLVYDAPRPPLNNVYSATLHAGLSDPEGCTLIAGWYAPTSAFGGQNHLLELTLR